MGGNSLPGIDRRMYPRIEVRPNLNISGDLKGELIDISENGIGFASDGKVGLERCEIRIDFPVDTISLPVDVKWASGKDDGGPVLGGALLVEPKKEVSLLMRKYMVTKQFRYLVEDIDDRGKRKEMLSFAKDFRDYIFELDVLNREILKNKKGPEEIYSKLNHLNNEIVARAEGLKGKIKDPGVIERIKDSFRSLVSSWIFKSPGSYRCLEKPKGYPGDYETLEIIYDRKVLSEARDLGYYFDMYFLNNPYAEAVRKRKDKLKDILANYIARSERPLKVLNLACGGCKELRDICSERPERVIGKDVSFYCLDWDAEALDFSRDQLGGAPGNFNISFVRENILSFIRRTGFFDENGQMDVIYSIGLADYFRDRILRAMMHSAYKGLKPGGRFIIAHKDKEISFSHVPPEWFGDWTFYQRNEQDLYSLINETGLDWSEIKIDRDETGDIFFYTLVKR
jgi:SAM-dependent methyltransferase